MSGDAETLTEVLREAYRLGYTDRSKERDFDPGLALDLRDWLAAHDAAIRAEAWDEGWLASKRHERGEGQPKMTYWPNPYRQALRAAQPTEGESPTHHPSKE